MPDVKVSGWSHGNRSEARKDRDTRHLKKHDVDQIYVTAGLEHDFLLHEADRITMVQRPFFNLPSKFQIKNL